MSSADLRPGAANKGSLLKGTSSILVVCVLQDGSASESSSIWNVIWKKGEKTWKIKKICQKGEKTWKIKKICHMAPFFRIVCTVSNAPNALWGSTWTFGISYFLCINLYSLSLIFTVILPYLTIINHLSDGLNGFLVKSTIIFCTLPFLWLKRFKS